MKPQGTNERNECTPTDTHMYTVNKQTHTDTHRHTETQKYRRQLSAIGRVHTDFERNLDQLVYRVDHKVSQAHILKEPLSVRGAGG